MYVLDALEFHSRMKPHEIAIIHEGGVSTFQHLREAVRAAAARLRATDLNADLPVAVYVTDPFLHFVLVLALMHEALASFSGHPNYDAPPPGVAFGAYLCDRQMPFMAPTRIVSVDENWTTPFGSSSESIARRSFMAAPSLVRIIASSGTTGLPKAMAFNAEQVDQGIDFPNKIGFWGEAPSITLIGLASAPGYRHMMSHLQLGKMQVLVSPKFDVVNAILRHEVKFLVASPAQLQGILGFVEQFGIRLPSLKHIRVAGSAVSPIMVLRVRMRLCPNVTGDYGATEVGKIAEAPAELMERIPGCAGYVHPWMRVEIVDRANRVLPAETEGEVRVRSPTMIAGYLGETAEIQTVFRDGWFYPGDLGMLTKDGILVVSGRATELINAGGVKVSPNLINNVLASVGGVVDAAAFGVEYPDRATEIWAAVVTMAPLDEAALINACASALNSRAPQKIVRVDQIPRNSMGKILTDELRRQVVGR